MNISLPYNGSHIAITIPDKHFAGFVEPQNVTAQESLEKIIKNALANCSGSLSYSDIIHGPGTLFVIINDGTRPTPTKYVLDIIADDLAEAGAEFIVATGVHRGPTEDEYKFIFGRHYERFADFVHVHDARKSEDMVYLGRSGQGTDIFINRLGYEADKVLVIGSVEPHYFAGYTGGRKAFSLVLRHLVPLKKTIALRYPMKLRL